MSEVIGFSRELETTTSLVFLAARNLHSPDLNQIVYFLPSIFAFLHPCTSLLERHGYDCRQLCWQPYGITTHSLYQQARLASRISISTRLPSLRRRMRVDRGASKATLDTCQSLHRCPRRHHLCTGCIRRRYTVTFSPPCTTDRQLGQ